MQHRISVTHFNIILGFIF